MLTQMAAKRKRRETALSRESEDRGWQAVITRIGGREGLLRAAIASAGPNGGEKAAMLAELLLDPAFKQYGTKKLAQRAGLSLPEIVDLFRNKQWLESTIALHEKLPEIVGGAAEDAAPGEEPCAECKTKGKNEKGEDCWICGGHGYVRRPGDQKKLDFIGEAAGMTAKGGPVFQNNLQIVNNGGQVGRSFEDLVRKATVNVKPRQQLAAPEAEIVENGD